MKEAPQLNLNSVSVAIRLLVIGVILLLVAESTKCHSQSYMHITVELEDHSSLMDCTEEAHLFHCNMQVGHDFSVMESLLINF